MVDGASLHKNKIQWHFCRGLRKGKRQRQPDVLFAFQIDAVTARRQSTPHIRNSSPPRRSGAGQPSVIDRPKNASESDFCVRTRVSSSNILTPIETTRPALEGSSSCLRRLVRKCFCMGPGAAHGTRVSAKAPTQDDSANSGRHTGEDVDHKSPAQDRDR
jgi:hypothetical protein